MILYAIGILSFYSEQISTCLKFLALIAIKYLSLVADCGERIFVIDLARTIIIINVEAFRRRILLDGTIEPDELNFITACLFDP